MPKGLGFRREVRVHVLGHLYERVLVVLFLFGLFHLRGFERRQVAVDRVGFSAVEKNSGTRGASVDVDFRAGVFRFFHFRTAGRTSDRLASVGSSVPVFHLGENSVGWSGEKRAHFVVFEKHPFALLADFHGSLVDGDFHERNFAKRTKPFDGHRFRDEC